MESEKCRPPSRHLTVDEVPDHFRELYIQSAYRNPNSSFAECLRSVFEATNETFNFWTHILPSMYFIWWMYAIFPDVSSDAYAVPFIAYSVSVCVFPVASALAHVFNTMSDHARHVCFFVDYAGLSFYALGSAVAYKAYSFPRSLGGTVFAEIYFPCAAIMAVLSMTLCCATRLMPNSFLKKILRMSSMAFPYLFDVIPVVYRYLFEDTEDLTQGIYPHMRQFIFTFLSAFFYISHLPERAFPGYFDVFGHSHQIFHTMSILGARDQLQAVLLDLKDRRHLSTVMVDQDESGISFHVLSIIVMSLVSMINIIQLLVFSSQLHHVIPQGIGTRKLAAWQHHRRASLNCCDQATDEVENFCFDHRFPTKADSANNNAMIIKRRKIMLEYIE